jgi:diaminohydroxyphosphoribosylaminopyrimidine deaminase / 5-amino-6-(5-phosphoribosylamino)uracil reductase
MSGETDLKFIHRCLELASRAEGNTYPNPLVGSVIVHEGLIIGEGFHRKAGGPHAEAAAIESVRNKKLLSTSTLYVNLEPCSHFGKTPPCADLIISYKIPRIVVGTKDTSEKVSGRGLEKMKSSGSSVTVGVAEEECRRINRRFFTFNEKKRPYITLKWAESTDGFLDIKRGSESVAEINWITGKPERILVHKWRASEQSILVGAGTVRIDDPKLNVREWKGNNPLRVILSGSGKLPEDIAMIHAEGSTIIFTCFPEKINLPDVIPVKLNDHEPAALQISNFLYESGLQSLLIEGGRQVLEHFITSGIWDEARVFRGKTEFGDGIKAPEIRGRSYLKQEFSSSSLEIIINDK